MKRTQSSILMFDQHTHARPEGLKPGINPDDLVPLPKAVSYKLPLIFVVLCVAVVLVVVLPVMWVVVPHLRASSQLRSITADVDWSVNRSNWKLGGSTAVVFRERFYNPNSRGNFGDEELALLRNLLNVEEVTVMDWTRMTDEGLTHIAELPNLNSLEISTHSLDQIIGEPGKFRMTDAGLAILQNAKKLRSLTLIGANISDSGLQHLGAIQTLESLDLSETPLTNAGLEHLKSLPNLEFLILERTNVSQKATAALQSAMPKLKMITVSGPNSPGFPLLR